MKKKEKRQLNLTRLDVLTDGLFGFAFARHIGREFESRPQTTLTEDKITLFFHLQWIRDEVDNLLKDFQRYDITGAVSRHQSPKVENMKALAQAFSDEKERIKLAVFAERIRREPIEKLIESCSQE